MSEIRKAVPADVDILCQMILECAEESNARFEVNITPERLLDDGFGVHPRFEALVAWETGEATGFALWFPMYSSWKGRKTMYLEDLYVRPLARRKGLAHAMFRFLENRALEAHSNLAWECDRDRLDLRHFFVTMGAIDRSSKVSYYMEEPEMRAHLTDETR
ncbi:MAG TPA: GNAT family N-acetyltransferase [Fibrobacteraceae bacterium]|nr:GNAT family N-acetyltransferase [Fibrobacteraceae bacterium]